MGMAAEKKFNEVIVKNFPEEKLGLKMESNCVNNLPNPEMS